MDIPNKKNRNALARSKPGTTTDYTVGYAKPPSDTRFKPGHSGNPQGRPKGQKNKTPLLNEERLKSIILQEAYRNIKVNDGNRQVSVPMAQAIVRSLAVNAAKGNTRAQRLFSEMLSATETSHKRLYDERLETAIEYKVNWERELYRRQQLGISGPDPLPHPDHITINMATGLVEINGPMTPDEKVKWDHLAKLKSDIELEIADLKLDLADPSKQEIHEVCRQELAHNLRLLALFGKKFG